MKLEGSCHCQRVRFTCHAQAPVPYMLCYCSICRKTAGTGGFAINLGARHDTLEVQGREHIAIYHARLRKDDGSYRESSGERHFCKHCGTALWLYDPNWPELFHPHASAIDTPLPDAPERVHILLDSKANWVPVPDGPHETHFDHYPDESLEQWHRRHGLLDPPDD
jgi:hypothetical protein